MLMLHYFNLSKTTDKVDVQEQKRRKVSSIFPRILYGLFTPLLGWSDSLCSKQKLDRST